MCQQVRVFAVGTINLISSALARAIKSDPASSSSIIKTFFGAPNTRPLQLRSVGILLLSLKICYTGVALLQIALDLVGDRREWALLPPPWTHSVHEDEA